MTVVELIEYLQTLPPEAEVVKLVYTSGKDFKFNLTKGDLRIEGGQLVIDASEN